MIAFYRALSVSALLSMCSFSYADEPRTLIEAAFGQSQAKTFCDDFDSNLCEDTDRAFRVGVSQLINTNLRANFSYIDFGQFEINGANSVAQLQISAKASAVAAQLEINAPIAKAAVYMRGGLAISFVEVKAFGQNFQQNIKASSSENDTSLDPILGLGFRLPLNEHIGLMGEYQLLMDAGNEETTGEDDVSFMGVGIQVTLQ
ncbi:outer membrane beta-barrel protein [Agitococcus lubricus]|uniref:Outer membrane protein with beta-barrel domain n=1 Tax=Agitococcus lubricus TaxID=1077255 RepID=A0A2T5IYG5_9GAMM|nr:outer membrane beta-barrel protein [Agitococcus lubricus]PTQ88934.1 outer membrane protein with beta-barrel domain [Agitococcus lubricus]